MIVIEYLMSNMIFTVFILICAVTFIIRLPYFLKNKHIDYSYSAKTKYYPTDHYYHFSIEWADGEYYCYIERTPSFSGRDTLGYTPHYWVEQYTDRKYICWTSKIIYPKQAKTLCRMWADATQQFIDTGIPAPGFERQ